MDLRLTLYLSLGMDLIMIIISHMKLGELNKMKQLKSKNIMIDLFTIVSSKGIINAVVEVTKECVKEVSFDKNLQE